MKAEQNFTKQNFTKRYQFNFLQKMNLDTIVGAVAWSVVIGSAVKNIYKLQTDK